MDWVRQNLKLIASMAMLSVAGFLWVANSGPASPIPDRFDYICVSTGEMFNLSNDEAAMIPARHPQTRVPTLIPCTRDADGAVVVEEGFRFLLEGELSRYNHVIDLETMRVKTGK